MQFIEIYLVLWALSRFQNLEQREQLIYKFIIVINSKMPENDSKAWKW